MLLHVIKPPIPIDDLFNRFTRRQWMLNKMHGFGVSPSDLKYWDIV
jgi:hypothetical protein